MAEPAKHAANERERSATDAQTKASDPAGSAWVAANAGTGKTHVLANRVLRLLVTGTKPERILCLTYTKAAAAEMASRVFERLAQWVVADDLELARALEALQRRRPTPEELARARDLFTIAIETPGGLKVQTIHAFCERLLQRFPLEANVPPGFAILDDEMTRVLQRDAIEDVLITATREPAAPLGKALSHIIAFAADDGFDELLRDALGRRDWLEAASRLDLGANDELAAAGQLYRRALGVPANATLAELDQKLAQSLPEATLRRVSDVLRTGTSSDIQIGDAFAAAVAATSDRARSEALTDAFLTGGGEPRKRLMTKALATAHADLAAILDRVQGRFVRLLQDRGNLAVVEATMALVRVASAVLARYTALKARRAALDFDDLIRKTGALLATGEQAAWVLFKLDGGLDHILVDEAQDTSERQWAVIHALAQEFYAGTGARSEQRRTVFAVGDEKQSIYSFQGAAPEQFAAMGETFRSLAARSGQPWSRIPLTVSFRTVAPILEAVDRVFADQNKVRGLTASGDPVRHAASRIGMAGRVEIWDTEKPETTDDAPIWQPHQEVAQQSPVSRLANRIAETIKGWIDAGERLVSEDRPIRPGDVLILVRKRLPFADAMVAALKDRKVPVAGADRIRLSDQLAMLDLLVLGDFLLLPEDDLALATILKSPLFDLDDDDLIEIAPRRRGSLWSSLLGASRNIPRLRPAAETLKRWRSRADLMPPYEFFVEVLDRDGMRARLLARLGPEAADPIDEFLSLALTYDDSAPPSLQGFIDWLRASDRQIKRDMEHGRDEVRVMTVHGAKGLEAPIVFLPDTCTTGSGQRPGSLLVMRNMARPIGVPEPFVWPIKGSKALDTVKDVRAEARESDGRERNRLLYVAMTRPRDRLYVAGFEGAKGREAGCWYDLIREAIDEQAVESMDAAGRAVWRIEAPQEAAAVPKRDAAVAAVEPLPPPSWARRPAPREPGRAVPLVPSQIAPLETDAEGEPVERPRERSSDAPPMSPKARTAESRFLRGTLTHALLQHLPGQDPAHWDRVARRFVETRGADLKPRTRTSIVTETLAVLRDPQFAPLFGPASRAEVPIVAEIAPPFGDGETVRVTGQIDRLVRLEKEIWIVDYKTNRPPPHEIGEVAEAYLLQLAAYRLVIGRIYPGLAVRATLLWTDGPRIMEMPDALLDGAEKRLFIKQM